MYKTGDICPVCATGEMSEKVITEKFEYKGKKFKIPDYHVFTCGNCKEEFVSRKTILATEKTLTDYRRKVDGLLTSDEIKAIRHKLGKTQAGMAELLGVGGKNFARYENSQVTQSKSMDTLLRILNIYPSAIDEIRNKSEYKKFAA